MMRARSTKTEPVRRLLTGLLCLLLSTQAIAAVRAHLDRDKVYVGDPVTLVIESSGAASGEPDLSPLQKDFRVLGTGTSTQFSFVNGRSSNRTTWTIQLGPLQTGKLRIPPIQVGSERTAELELEVTEVPEQVAAQQSEHLFLEAEVDTDDHAYVQQQITYTLRFYNDETVIGGDLRPPQVKDAVMRQLGDERRYTVTRNNRRYRVTERRYAISPEKSGTLHIPPATFNGQISTAQPGMGGQPRQNNMMQRLLRNNPFGGGGKTVRAHSRPITIEVRSRPAQAGGAWLPAESLELHDSWADDPPQMRAGEPLTRTLLLRATGLSGTQIPELQLETPDHVRIYPETPVNESHTDGDKVYAISRQTFTYIPGRAGELTIPAVEVPWWNTRGDQQATARLPQWVIKVEPGTAATSTERSRPSPLQSRPAPPAADPQSGQRTSGPGWFSGLEIRPWHWVLALFALVLVVATANKTLRARLGMIKVPRRSKQTASASPSAPAPGVDSILPRLQTACETDDAAEAARTLLELGHARWPQDPPNSLGQLAHRLGDGQEEILLLDRALYAADAQAWNGTPLWNAVKDAWTQQPRTPNRVPQDLAPLYPHHN